MKSLHVRPSSTPRAARRTGAPPVEFRTFVAYDDVAAARDALAVVNGVLRAAPRPHRLEPMLWRCDQLEHVRWQEASLHDAAAADVVVLARAGRTPLSPALETWVAQLLARKRGSRVTLVALLGHDEAWTISIDVPATRVLAEPAAIAALSGASPADLTSRAA